MAIISLNTILTYEHNKEFIDQLTNKYNTDTIHSRHDHIGIFNLVKAIMKQNEDTLHYQGIIDKDGDNFAFIRSSEYMYANSFSDVYVSHHILKQYPYLTTGDKLGVSLQLRKKSNKDYQLYCHSIEQINDINVNDYKTNFKQFKDLTPQYPVKKIVLKHNLTSRMVDIVAPIGLGQRGLIVASPKAGKTMVLQTIALDLLEYNPNCKVILLMIGERPEECTESKRKLNKQKYHDRLEILGSTFDETAYRHTELANIALEMSKRLVEQGKDVVILLDSLTRLTRSYNEISVSSGRVMTGGIEAKALQASKKFLGSARSTQESGSLTILASVLIDTGLRMDDIIFEEFKGTGNMELFLSRKSAEKCLFPAIDLAKSGTRRADLFLNEDDYQKTMLIKRILNNKDLDNHEALELLYTKLKAHDTNQAFFDSLNKSI